MAKKGPYRKITAPVAVEQLPGQSRGTDLPSDPNKELLVCSYKNQVMNTLSRNRGALPGRGGGGQPGLLDCMDLMAWHT